MRSTTILLALSLAATFLAFAAPADACAGTACIPGCTQDRCPPGCGDNIGCCQPGSSIVECFVPHCTQTFCIDLPPVPPCVRPDCIPTCYGPLCINDCTYLLGCPPNLWCNNLYCYTPPPLA